MLPLQSAAEALAQLKHLRSGSHADRRHRLTRVIEWVEAREVERDDLIHGTASLLADAAQRVGEAVRVSQAPRRFGR